MRKILILFLVIFFAAATNTYGVNLENSHTYRYDIRGEDGGDIYFIKLAIKEKKNLECIKRDLTLGAFVEGRYAFDIDDFSMSKTGILAGINLIKWFYLLEDIHFANNTKKDIFVWRSNVGANCPFNLFNLKPSLKIFDEFSFNLEEGEGSRNDSGLGINVPFTEFLSGYIGWRHADRIHSYDTDYIESVVTLTF